MYTWNDALKEANQEVKSYGEEKRKKRNETMDYLVNKSKLAEAGYDVNGEDIVQRPDYVSSKQAEAQKTLAETEMTKIKLDRMRRAMGGGMQQPLGGQAVSPLGTPQASLQQVPQADASGLTTYMDDNGEMKTIKDPRYLNPLQTAKLQDIKNKQTEAQSAFVNKQEMVKNQAEDDLKTIAEVRKGKDYFGPLGNVPSIPIITGDYAKRKNWEANVNRLLSQKVLNVMNQMKSASKTGATGFGQLSNKELALLQNASTALNRGLAPDDAMRYLNDMEKIERKILATKTSVPGAESFSVDMPGEQEDDGLDQEAQAAIDGGADPEAVMARVKELRGK